MSSSVLQHKPLRLTRARSVVRESQAVAPAARGLSSDLAVLESRSDQPEAREVIRRAINSKRVRVVPDSSNPERIRVIPCHVLS